MPYIQYNEKSKEKTTDISAIIDRINENKLQTIHPEEDKKINFLYNI